MGGSASSEGSALEVKSNGNCKVVLIGPSDAGKSTFLRALEVYYPPPSMALKRYLSSPIASSDSGSPQSRVAALSAAPSPLSPVSSPLLAAERSPSSMSPPKSSPWRHRPRSAPIPEDGPPLMARAVSAESSGSTLSVPSPMQSSPTEGFCIEPVAIKPLASSTDPARLTQVIALSVVNDVMTLVRAYERQYDQSASTQENNIVAENTNPISLPSAVVDGTSKLLKQTLQQLVTEEKQRAGRSSPAPGDATAPGKVALSTSMLSLWRRQEIQEVFRLRATLGLTVNENLPHFLGGAFGDRPACHIHIPADVSCECTARNTTVFERLLHDTSYQPSLLDHLKHRDNSTAHSLSRATFNVFPALAKSAMFSPLSSRLTSVTPDAEHHVISSSASMSTVCGNRDDLYDVVSLSGRRAWHSMRDWTKALPGSHCVTIMVNLGGYDVADLSVAAAPTEPASPVSPASSPASSRPDPLSSFGANLPTRLQQDMRLVQKLCDKYWKRFGQAHIVLLLTHLDVFFRKMSRSVSAAQLQGVFLELPEPARTSVPMEICQIIFEYTDTSSPLTVSFPSYSEHQAVADLLAAAPANASPVIPTRPASFSSASISPKEALPKEHNPRPPRSPRFSFFRPRQNNDGSRKSQSPHHKYSRLLPSSVDPNSIHISVHASLQYIADQFMALFPKGKNGKPADVMIRALDVLHEEQVRSVWEEVERVVRHNRHLHSFSSLTGEL